MSNLKRHYFISDDLDDLDALEEELERAGIAEEKIHVLSMDDAAVEHHDHLHNVQSLMKCDVVHSGNYGLLLGVIAAALVLLAAWVFDWYQSAAGWWPFIFLALIVWGFFTWEAGLIGLHHLNVNFRRFRRELEEGRHVFFVDAEPEEEKILRRVRLSHPGLRKAGIGPATPHWIIAWQRRLHHH